VVLRCRLEAEAHADTERDLMGLVEELVADDGAGEEVWGSLNQKEREKLLSIFKHHNLNLTTAVRSVSVGGRLVGVALVVYTSGFCACLLNFLAPKWMC
jgi:hypothetical protein